MKRILEIAYGVCFLSILAGFIASVVFVWTHWGWYWGVAALIAVPAGILIPPLFALLDYGIWLPMALTFGPAPLLMLIGTIRRKYYGED